ncbi:hypothetical protein TNCV_1089361 [Trichonephila clavipes]|uniref:Uncharacterized protein n=1 Tax=Trichonephila clavipes TaxID=2585209 RepID=A0A8X6STJ4_TRICX|nr:hypothetical protein TNCV_1089361 [Trichonephila clavipes]
MPKGTELTQKRFRATKRSLGKQTPTARPVFIEKKIKVYVLLTVEDSKITKYKFKDNMLTKYQMIKFIDFCEVWFLPESVARVATSVGDHRCHTPRH